MYVIRSFSWRIGLVALLLSSSLAFAAPIRLRTGTIDTARQKSVDTAALMKTAGPDGKSLALIQFSGPVEEAWLDGLRQAGVTVHFYVPDHAYLVTLLPEELDGAKRAAPIVWTGALSPSLKRAPALRRYGSPGGEKSGGESLQKITILSVDEAPVAFLRKRGVNIISTRLSRLGWHDTRVAVPDALLAEISRLWSVFYIEPTPDFELHGERGAQTTAGNYSPGANAPTGPGFAAWLAANGLSGAPGIIVQVQDDGLDQGISTNQPGTAHPDIVGRIAGIFNATGDPLGDSAGGHGQINAGIIMGNATVGTTDGDGYLLGQGLAPLANVYGTKIFGNSGFFDIGARSFADLAKDAQDAGATYSSNSWGSAVSGEYTSDSAEFDALVRDADPVEPGNQPMTYFFSAGNSGPFAGSIGAPASAKNVITVGAGENSDQDGTDGCAVAPGGADSHRDLIDFSSRGPTTDGRQGVTLFAVGTHVQGPASTSPLYNGNGVCDKYWPTGQTNYARSSGTSHSCPTACGAGLLVHEFFNVQLAPLGHTPNPSPALMKAVLTNTATDMAGGNDGGGGLLDPVPNTEQGWGNINLSNLMDQKEAVYSFDQAQTFTNSGQVWEKLLTPVDFGKPLKITLAWTDAPASPLTSPVQVNDLDLVVIDGANTYMGNVFNAGFSTTGGLADRLNNVEGVYIQNPTGPVTVRVIAHNIGGDGVPNSGGGLDQDFAFFASNATDQSPKGIVVIAESAVQCGDTITVTVSDTNLQGAGTIAVAITSTLADAESLTLTETGPGTGVLQGTMPVSDSPGSSGDGIIQVADTATITATYNDADDGTGSPAVVSDDVGVDCVVPVISNARVTSLSFNRATVAFDTDEPCTGTVDFGFACASLPVSSAGAFGLTQHTVQLTGLLTDKNYYFTVSATDAAGNAATDDNGAACFTFRTLLEPGACPGTVVNNGSFEFGGFDGWIAETGPGSELQPWNIASAGSGWFANGTPDSGTKFAENGFDGDAGLYYELYREIAVPIFASSVEVQWADRIQWDTTGGGSISRPYRVTVQPAGGGPPLGTIYSFDVPMGNMGDTGWQTHTSNLLTTLPGIVGSTVRLSWRQDVPESFTGPAQFDLDTICVVIPEQSSAGTISLGRTVVACGSNLELQVSDTDLQGAGSVSVTVLSSLGDTETVLLTETVSGSGVLTGTIPMDAGAVSPGDSTLQIQDGGTVTAQYSDADDGTGSAAVATANANVDCQPPIISGVAVSNIAARRATVSFATSELTTGRVNYGTECGSLTETLAGIGSDTSFELNLAGLSTNTPYFFEVVVEDQAGNQVIDDNGGTCYTFATLDVRDYLTEQFAAGIAEFDLGFRVMSYRPAANLSGYEACIESALTTPTSPSGGTVLSLGDDDFAQVNLTGGKSVELFGVPYTSMYVGSNGYITFGAGDTSPSGSATAHFSLPRVSAFFTDLDPTTNGEISYRQLADRIAVTWDDVAEWGFLSSNTFQIELFFDGEIRIFWNPIEAFFGTVGLSDGGGFPNDFEPSNFSEFGACLLSAGTVAFDRAAYGCSATVRMEIADLDLVGAPDFLEQVSSNTGDLESVLFTEEAPNTGVFVSSIMNSTAPVVVGDGVLQVVDGGSISVSYNDADDGTGNGDLVTDNAAIDCQSPIITHVDIGAVTDTTAQFLVGGSEPVAASVAGGLACLDTGHTGFSPFGATEHVVTVTGLEPLTTYHFTATVADAAGNTAFDDNSGACYSFTTLDPKESPTELFDFDSPVDIEGTSILFRPVDGGAGYRACITPATSLPVSPAGGTQIILGLDDYEAVPISEGKSFPYFGQTYTSYFIGSHGFVTFGQGDVSFGGTIVEHFQLPRISGFFADLDPSLDGRVSRQQLSDRVVATWQDIPEFLGGGRTTFQIEMFFNGDIRITTMRVDLFSGVVGISDGNGVPGGFVSSDLSASLFCGDAIPVIVGGGFYEVGERLLLTVSFPGAQGVPTYSWYYNDSAIPGAFGDEFVIEALQLEDSGLYKVVVTDQSKAIFESAAVVVTVVTELPAWRWLGIILLVGLIALAGTGVMRRRRFIE